MRAHRYANVLLVMVATMSLGVAVGLSRMHQPDASAPVDEPRTLELPPTLNVLLVGVDRRFGAEKQHCDAIHMIRVDIAEESVEIVNVPRGTRWPFDMPDDWEPEPELYVLATQRLEERALQASQEDLATQTEDIPMADAIDPVVAEAWDIEQYVANICKYVDFESFVRAIERLTGHKADYTVRVGFSQTQAVARALGMDPVATLRFLRHRKTYPTGDVQRSYNQAVFLRDLIVEHADDASRVPPLVRRGLFRWLETDMPYAMAEDVLWWLAHSAVAEDESRVMVRTAPSGMPRAQEIHLGDDAASRVDELWERYRAYEPLARVGDTQTVVARAVDAAFARAYRAMVAGDAVTARQALATLETQPIWLQLEDARKRHEAGVVYAMIDIWVGLNERPLTPQMVETAETLAALIAAEDGGETYARRILEVTERYRALFP